MPTGPNGEKRPVDALANALHVARIATRKAEEEHVDTAKAKGGKARAVSVSAKRRSQIAKARTVETRSIMKRLAITLVVLATPAFAIDALCTAVAGGDEHDGCYSELSNLPGCHVWNPAKVDLNPIPARAEATVADGSPGCAEALLSGHGKVRWQWSHHEVGTRGHATIEADHRAGRQHGEGVFESHGDFVDGSRTWGGRTEGLVWNDGTIGRSTVVGTGLFHGRVSSRSQGMLDGNLRQGHWSTTSYSDTGGVASRIEGAYDVDGKETGRWSLTSYHDGELNTRTQGRYEAGKREGTWITTYYDGPDSFDGVVHYVNGEMVRR